MKRIHLILSLVTGAMLVGAVSQMINPAEYLAPSEFLPLGSFLALLVIPFLVIGSCALLRSLIVSQPLQGKGFLLIIVSFLFTTGAFLYGAGLGDHALANYLNARYCMEGALGGKLCEIVSYHDDYFSHYIYLIGFAIATVGLVATESIHVREQLVRKKDLIFILVNATIAALAIFATTAFSRAGIDILVYGLIAIVSIILLAVHGLKKQPVTWYFASAYVIGVLLAVGYKYLLV